MVGGLRGRAREWGPSPPHRDVTACVEPGVNDTAETRRAPSSHIAHLYQPTLQEVLANRGFRETLITSLIVYLVYIQTVNM